MLPLTRCVQRACLIGLATPLLVLGAQTTTTLDFDAMSLAPGTAIDPTGYLAGFGVFLSAVTAGDAADIYANGGGALPIAHSGSNYFLESTGNHPGSMTFEFAGTLSAVSFFRTALSYDSKPEWTAEALDGLGNVVATVGEPLTATGAVISAQLFTLTGSNIRALRFNQDNHAFTNLGGIPIDDLSFTTVSSAPEPATIALVGTGLLIVGAAVRRRTPKA